MTVVVIEEATSAHCPLICANLRPGDRKECEDAGLTASRAIYRSFRHSLYAKAFYVDGHLAAMFGLGGGVFSDVGNPWLFTTPAIEINVFAFVRCGRFIVDEMQAIKPTLENYVSANYPEACRLVRALGFRLGEPEPWGLHGAPFRKFSIGAP